MQWSKHWVQSNGTLTRTMTTINHCDGKRQRLRRYLWVFHESPWFVYKSRGVARNSQRRGFWGFRCAANWPIWGLGVLTPISPPWLCPCSEGPNLAIAQHWSISVTIHVTNTTVRVRDGLYDVLIIAPLSPSAQSCSGLQWWPKVFGRLEFSIEFYSKQVMQNWVLWWQNASYYSRYDTVSRF